MAERALATAFVNIVPGTKDLELWMRKGLPAEAEMAGTQAGKGMGSGLLSAAKSFVGPLIATFSVFAAVDFFKGAIESASNLSESQNAIKVTFGDAAGAIAKLGEDSATRLGLSTSAFNGIATQFSAFAGTIAGEGGNVAAVVDDLSTRGADFASVMNLDVNDALRLFQSGLAGETEPLRKYGIDMSAAAIEAYAMSAGIWDGVGTMTEAQKVQARYASLMEQTSKTAGDFTNTADGLANSQRIANAELENARAKFGDALLPVMADVTKFMADTFVPILEDLGNGLKWMRDNANIVIPVIAGLAAALLTVMAPAIWANVTALWGLAAAFMATPLGWISAAVAGLIAIIVALVMNWDAVVKWVTDVFGPVFEWLGDIFTWLWENALKPVVDAIAMAWDWLYNTIILPIIQGIVIYISIWAAIFTWLWENVLSPIFGFIGDIFVWIYENIIKPVIDQIVMSVEAWGKIFTWLYENGIKPAFEAIGKIFDWIWKNVIKPTFDWIVSAVQNVGKVFTDIFTNVSNFVRDIFNGIVNFIRGPVNAIIDLVNGAIDGLNSIKVDIPEWARTFFGGASSFSLNIPNIPALAKGGLVTSPTMALIGEAGPEVVTPLADFERMMNQNGNGQTIVYNAAPNESIDSEQALNIALKRAKVLAAW